MAIMNDLLVERVMRLVEAVPAGRATTYGALASAVGAGPRVVARILAEWGSGAPWWRVVNAKGELPGPLALRARPMWALEGVPLLGSPGGAPRVDLPRAGWAKAEIAAALDRVDASLETSS